MHVPLFIGIGILSALLLFKRTAGRTDKERPGRIVFLHSFSDRLPVHLIFPKPIQHIIPTVSFIQLIISRPYHDTGSVDIFSDDDTCFFKDLLKEACILRKNPAGQHHILEDHDTLFITGIQEMLRLINTSAPDTQHGYIGIHNPADIIIVFLIPDFSVNTVKRYPIGPADKKPLSVHAEKKASPPFILLLNQFHRANAESEASFIQNTVFSPQANPYLIEKRIPIRSGPPQPGLIQGKRKILRFLTGELSCKYLFPICLKFQQNRLIRLFFYVIQDTAPQTQLRTVPFQPFRNKLCIMQDRMIPAFEQHRLPNSCCETMAAEIPSPVHLRLAQKHSGRIILRINPFSGHIRRVAKGGEHLNHQAVFLTISEKLRHIKGIFQIHVPAHSQADAVQPDSGYGINAFKTKGIFFRFPFLFHIKGVIIYPILFFNPSFLIQILAIIISVNISIPFQRRPDVLRHPGIHPVVRIKSILHDFIYLKGIVIVVFQLIASL